MTKYLDELGVSRFLAKLKTYISNAISNISASNITHGVLAVANGGTGQSDITEHTADIVTAQAGYTVTTASMEQWGKVAMLSVGIRTSGAMSSGTDYKVAVASTIARPKTFTGFNATGGVSASCRLYTDGSLMVRPINTIASGTAFTLMATYLLA